MNLSPLKRLELIRLINALPDPEFDEMAFALNPRGGIVPPSEAAQGRRGKALLEWVEGPTGCGMAAFLELFNAIASGKFEPASLISHPKPHAPASAVTLKQTASPQSQPVAPSSKANPSLTLALGFGVSLELVYIPGGRFWMGSPKTEEGRDIYQLFNKSLTNVEGPQHEVTVPAFYMGKYLVTQRQWRAVSLLDNVGRQHLPPNPACFRGNNLPVEQVNWHGAVEFCKHLSSHTRQHCRLPSEAEWEYACRAGTNGPFYFGETISTEQANYRGTDDEFRGQTLSGAYGKGKLGIYREKTTVVGSFSANDFGLHDMHGNVWEWCQDVWHDSYEDAPVDAGAWITAGNQGRRTIRGGSWGNNPKFCRSASRYNRSVKYRFFNIGFRVCCTAPQEQATTPRLSP
ncbi:MAG: formylglycine-generating enzyme family protein [Leptolyngbyaceae cyanobacterium]